MARTIDGRTSEHQAKAAEQAEIRQLKRTIMRNNRSTVLHYLIIFLVAFVANICAADEEVEQQPISLEVQARWSKIR